MPRARDPRREKAKEIWLDSGKNKKLCDIAKELDLPEATVRAWKTKDNWENKLKKNEGSAPKEKAEREEVPKNAPEEKPKKRRGGAPLGNKFGKGSGKGNLQAAKHGGYVNYYDGVLTEEEKEYVEHFRQENELDKLNDRYLMLALTERKLMKHVKCIEEGEDFTIEKIVKTTEGTETITKKIKVSEEQNARAKQLKDHIDALTRIRTEMRKVIDSIRKLKESMFRINIAETKDGESGTLADIVLNAYKERRGAGYD